MNKLILATSLALAACAMDPQEVDTATDTQDLSAADVTHTYYSDATFQTIVGETEVGVACGPGKRTWGHTTAFMAIDSQPCRTGYSWLKCYTWQDYGTDGDFVEVTCPPNITFSVGF